MFALDASAMSSPAPAPQMALQPVFLHGGWRSCSTYVWSKFRALDGALAFYEPFHEALAGLTPQAIAADTAETSNLRHPRMGAPYMAEFEDLLAVGGGVRGYRPRFAMDSYFMDADDEDPAQEAYVAGLIKHARSQGRTPVLGCCRSLGRAGWLRRRFGGVHITLMRDPISQWASGHEFRRRPDRASYFELCPFAILGLAGGRAAAWARRWGAPWRLSAGDPDRVLRQLRANLFCRRPAASYAAFAAVYVLAHLRAIEASDMILDMDRLSLDSAYAAAAARTIAAASGLTPDFGDCSAPRRAGVAPSAPYEAIHAALWTALADEVASPHAPALAARLEASAAAVTAPAESGRGRARSWAFAAGSSAFGRPLA
jgi:hypothetical protein